MTTRVLPKEEWHRLHGTEAETVWPHLLPDSTEVIVIEDDAQQIVACWVAMRVTHAECLWIAPSHRGRFDVMRRLLSAMRSRVRAWGGTTFVTAALDDRVRGLIERVGGTRLNAEFFVMPAQLDRVIGRKG